MSLPVTPTAVAALAVVALGACGDSAPSKEAYVKDANALCETFNTKIKANTEPTDTNDTNAIANYLDQLADLAHEETEELKDLDRPEGDTDELEGIYDAQAQQMTQVRDTSAKLKSGDMSGAVTLLASLETGSTNVDQSSTAAA